MRLREDLDVERQRHDGPVALGEHHLRDLVRLGQEGVAGGHARSHHHFQAAEQLLVLQLLVGQAHQRLERDLVTQAVVAAQLGGLGADEALDQREHVRVGAALNVRQQALFGGRQEREGLDLRQAVGQELAAVVEFAAADHVAVDVPAHALGDFDGLGIAAVRGNGAALDHLGFHGVLV